MRTESATATITRAVTVAAGVYAPGHLGELTQYLPFELVDDVLAQAKAVQRRLRVLPPRAGVYFVLALGMSRIWVTCACGASWLLGWPGSTCRTRRRRRCGICAGAWAPGR